MIRNSRFWVPVPDRYRYVSDRIVPFSISRITDSVFPTELSRFRFHFQIKIWKQKWLESFSDPFVPNYIYMGLWENWVNNLRDLYTSSLGWAPVGRFPCLRKPLQFWSAICTACLLLGPSHARVLSLPHGSCSKQLVVMVGTKRNSELMTGVHGWLAN